MERIRPIRFNKVKGIADLGKAGAGLLIKLDAEGPGRSWFALLPSGSHDPADMRGVDLKDAEPVCPDCPKCYGTSMSLPYDCVRRCEGCGGWRWMGNSMIWSQAQEDDMRRRELLPGQSKWLSERWAHIRRLRGEEGSSDGGLTGSTARTA